ncbi:MAG TPA: PIN domain-containing protein [Candidatus Kapabacteria bacterium]|nr:PIN domain-containing protein [Candidatus Kapabacteria bacterium]
MNYVFDACALIAYVRGEPGNLVIEDILLDSRSTIAMHAINACEAYYDFVRTDRRGVADAVISDSISAGVNISEAIDAALWKAAGDLKAELRRISLADAFALAFSKRMDATLVTSDHKEFDKLVDKGICKILFIR